MDYLARNRECLPNLDVSDNASLKSTLEGSFYLKVTQFVDISKPIQDTSSPFLDVDDDEDDDNNEAEEETDRSSVNYNVKKIKGKYATKGAGKKEILKKGPRMLQLDLRDQNNTLIKAIETSPVDKLNDLKANSIVQLLGPMEIRCCNIMLEPRNVGSVIPM